MAEWLFEEGIGETRAILIEAGNVVEAVVELPGAVRAGAITEARLTEILLPGRRGIVTLEGGGEGLIEPLPPKFTEGQRLRVEIVREAVPEAGRAKLARCRATDRPSRPGPDLLARIAASGAKPIRVHSHGPDRLEEAGWSELLDQAASGEIPFEGGALRMSLTPAMTLFDIDGALPPPALAVAGAAAAARSIRRFAIAGSIGLDLPTMPGRAERQAAAAVIDALLPQPFERTAVNGFGFLQIVRRKERPSLPELIQADPIGAAARALLRRAERARGTGIRTLVAAPAVLDRLGANPAWLELLARRTGTGVALQADPALAIFGGHAHSHHH